MSVTPPSRRRFGAAAITATVVASLFGGVAVAAAASPTYSISGTVSLGSSSVKAGSGDVQPYVMNEQTQWIGAGTAVATDAQGNYSVAGLAPGRYILYFQYRGSSNFAGTYWGSANQQSLAPRITIVGSSVTARDITLPLKTTVTGTVSLGSPGNHPGTIATIAWARQDGPGQVSLSGSTSSAPDGTFSLPMDPGYYWFTMSAAGFQTASPSFTVVSGATFGGVDITLLTLGSITGHITLGTNGPSAGAGAVRISYDPCDPWCYGGSSVLTDANGNFTIPYLMPLRYTLSVHELAGAYKDSNAEVIVTNASPNQVADFTLAKFGSLHGSVRVSPGGRLATAGEVRVELTERYGQSTRSTLVDASGNYSFANVALTEAYLHTTYLGTDYYSGTWFDGLPDQVGATSILGNGNDVTQDLVLAPGGAISGKVLASAGISQSGVIVTATKESYATPRPSYTTTTDATGSYSLQGLPPGTYGLSFTGESFLNSVSNWVTQNWGETATRSDESLAIVAGQTSHLADFRFLEWGQLSGNPTCAICSNGMTYANQFYSLQVKLPDGTWQQSGGGFTTTVPYAVFGFNFLLPGTYRVVGSYANATDWGSGISPEVVVAEGQDATTPLTLGHPTPTRIAGLNRFETSARIADAWITGRTGTSTPVVYVANGLNYPDALSAGPAAIRDKAPILLVTPSEIPKTTRDELAALHPDKIVIVGGTASVSTAVETQLASLAGSVVRIYGPDRYATSREIANYSFVTLHDQSPTDHPAPKYVFIANGRNFPDAVGAGPAAARLDGPIILVNGAAPVADQATLDLIRSLNADQVTILGGANSVSAGIESSIRASLLAHQQVNRIEGANRYDTSAQVNMSAAFEFGSPVILAVGTNYPDALSGGALAGYLGGTILTTSATCLPQSTAAEIAHIAPSSITLLGGPTGLTPQLMSLSICP